MSNQQENMQKTSRSTGKTDQMPHKRNRIWSHFLRIQSTKLLSDGPLFSLFSPLLLFLSWTEHFVSLLHVEENKRPEEGELARSESQWKPLCVNQLNQKEGGIFVRSRLWHRLVPVSVFCLWTWIHVLWLSFANLLKNRRLIRRPVF